MKIILMEPLICLTKTSPSIPDIGLGYLAAAIKKTSHLVQILGWNMEPSIDAFKDYLKKYQPQVVGVKVFTKDVLAAIKTISIIKFVDPSIVIIIGGPHPSADHPERIMHDFPCDFAFQGEAEIGLPRLLNLLSRSVPGTPASELGSNDLKDIPGLIWREDSKIFNNPRIFVRDLDSIGFPLWELMRPEDYLSPPIQKGKGYVAPVILTRGCPGNCTFCSAYHVNGKKVRSRSALDFIDEIRHLYQIYDVRQFMITDNCFTFNKSLMIQICHLLISENFDIVFDCVSYENLDNLDQETLPLLKRAGCQQINMGIECGSERIRKTINKRGILGYIKEKEALIMQHGIKVRAFFIIGFPHEKKQDVEDTLKFARFLKTKDIRFEICFPLPGSEAYRYLLQRYEIDHINWSIFNVNSSPYPMGELPSNKLLLMKRNIQLRESFRSRKIGIMTRGMYRYFKESIIN